MKSISFFIEHFYNEEKWIGLVGRKADNSNFSLYFNELNDFILSNIYRRIEKLREIYVHGYEFSPQVFFYRFKLYLFRKKACLLLFMLLLLS